jgi:hypothetical protein
MKVGRVVIFALEIAYAILGVEAVTPGCVGTHVLE